MATARESQQPSTDNAFLAVSLHGGSHEPVYSGALSFMRRKYSRDLKGVDAVIWGVPFDSATGNRPGARLGPQAIRRASAMLEGDPQYPFRMDPFSVLRVVDYGDCALDYGRVDQVPAQIETEAQRILQSGAHLISLGGDHFITYPLLRAHCARHGPLSLVHFDAHPDSWEDDGVCIDHGVFATRAVREAVIDSHTSIQIGVRTHADLDMGFKVVTSDDVDEVGELEVANIIRRHVGDRRAYLTFDIDCLDPAFAPGTGVPVVGGLSTAQALRIVRRLKGMNFVGMDVVEVSPPFDHSDITALAAATLTMNYICLLAASLGS